MTEQLTTTQETQFAIATSGLTKRYDRYVAVNEVDLKIKSGEVFGLMGNNGAGKTTLMRLLATVEAPSKGEIFFYGDRLEVNNNTIKKYLGYVPDHCPFYEDMSVWDYLDYFARLYKIPTQRRQIRLYEVLELVKLEEKRHSLIPTLSKGMKQRLNLARAIIHEPIILLLDEPISGLDALARQQFSLIIQVLKEAGMTIVMASPILQDLTELCTTIGVMDCGFLVDTVALNEIKNNQSSQQIMITTLGDLTILEQELNKCFLVQKWEKIPQKNSFKISFLGDESDGAIFLRSLVAKGLPITKFEVIQKDWETIVLNKINYLN